MTGIEAVICSAEEAGFICNEPPDHAGDHKAWAVRDAGDPYVAHTWPRKP